MSPTDVIGWVLTIAADLRRSQAKTLADLVAAAARVTRGTLSALGRCLPDTTAAKHRVKRAWRFCDNPRVHPTDVMAAVVRSEPVPIEQAAPGIPASLGALVAQMLAKVSAPVVW